MAKLSRWAIFMRAFLITLLAGAPTRILSQSAEEQSLWQNALDLNTVEAYYDYLSRYPTGAYLDEALAALARLGALGLPRQVPQVQSPAAPSSPSNTAPGLY